MNIVLPDRETVITNVVKVTADGEHLVLHLPKRGRIEMLFKNPYEAKKVEDDINGLLNNNKVNEFTYFISKDSIKKR